MHDNPSQVGKGDLNFLVERWIDQRTGGRVHGLRVEMLADRFIVHGYTGSYHVRQLALAATLESLEASQIEQPQVELNIEVGAAVWPDKQSEPTIKHESDDVKNAQGNLT